MGNVPPISSSRLHPNKTHTTMGITQRGVEGDVSKSGQLRAVTRLRSLVTHKAEVGRLDHIENVCLPEDSIERLLHQAMTKLEASTGGLGGHHNRGGRGPHKCPSRNCS